MRINNRIFSGERPKALAWNLESNEAQVAIDCELHSGGIVPMVSNLFERRFLGKPLTVYYFDGEWLSWEGRVSIAESPIGVSTQRVFWTGEEYPKQSTAAEYAQGKSYRMGVPTPAAPTIIGVTGDALESGSTEIDTFYVTSFVNRWGEEGDNSDPSDLVSYKTGQVIEVGNLGSVDDNAILLSDYETMVLLRLYRLDQGEARFVAEYPLDSNTVTDDTGTTVLGDTFATGDFIPPPAEMKGLHIMANNVALGFVGRTVHVSEPGQLNAWPYEFPVQSEVIGISSFDNTAVILTKGYPEVASIYDPTNISPSMLAEREPCVSIWSIVQAVEGVMYAAPSGLFFIGPSGGQMLTKDYMDELDWQKLKPATFHSAYRDGEYFAWHEGDAEGRCMVFDTRETNAVLRQLSAYHQAAHVRTGSDDMFLADGSVLEKYQGGTDRLTYRWRSKEHGVGNPTAFTSARVISKEFVDDSYKVLQQASAAARAEAKANNAASLLLRSLLGVADGYGGAINQNPIAGGESSILPGSPADLGKQPHGVAIAAGTDVIPPDEMVELVLDVVIIADAEVIDTTRVEDEEPYRLQYADRARHWEYELQGNVDIAQFDMAGSESEMHDGS